MQIERGFASRGPAALPIHLMAVTHVEHAAVVRFNCRESIVLHSAPLRCLLDHRVVRACSLTQLRRHAVDLALDGSHISLWTTLARRLFAQRQKSAMMAK